MQLVVAGDDLRVADRQRAAAVIGDEAARFAHQQAARGSVPRLEIAFPEPVVAPGGNPREVERGRTEAADAGDLRADRGENPRPFAEIAMTLVGNAGSDQRFAEMATGGN